MATRTRTEAAPSIFPQITLKSFSPEGRLLLSGFPHLTAQTYFIVTNQTLEQQALFWFLQSSQINTVKTLLEYWQKIFKVKRTVWALDSITPLNVSRLLTKQGTVILVDVSQLTEKLPSLDLLPEYQQTLQTKHTFSLSSLIRTLDSFGYERADQAAEPGYYAQRGGIVDFYPEDSERPIRCEFNQNEISSLNLFNPISKRITQPIKRCVLTARVFSHVKNKVGLSSYIDVAQDPLLIYHDTEDLKSETDDWAAFQNLVKRAKAIILRDFSKKALNATFNTAPFYRRNFNKMSDDFKQWMRDGWQIACATNRPRELKILFKEKKLATDLIQLWPFSHAVEGFKNDAKKLILFTDREIFGEETSRDYSPRKRVDQAFILGLKPGDYVVHLDHGIGRFHGMREDVIEGVTKEYFVLQYAEGDKLSVPVEMADKVSKYIGISHPKLHRLSGGQWYQLTRKVKQEAKVLAQELLKIYAKREMTKIKPFSKATKEEAELAKSFPYQETPDQATAIREVKNDLEQETPMDRLICGDVGFGKTEVAVRAAFKAVMNKKQVALLAPTTILTQQHYDTFKARLKKFPVSIGILSRFETDKEQQDTIEKLKAGVIDIVVGTHRLLSNDVNFKRLGLIIIDEEQRFGVKAKEKLKAFRTQSHILTLTATPIPRTLNIALSGVRDVSIIETPPEGRLPIETFIEAHDDALIKKALTDELERGGQAYYLHNKVETISFAAQEIQKLVPDAKIGIAHGRLAEKELAHAMADFDTKKTNVLVCSTIIENGLDLPNVNTLIIDNATNFGLAQLYQLRGRIGRGDRQAYAYFLYHRKQLKGNAKKRLQALLEAKKLGSGFQLALRDLEIRGAGNILGREQHGKVSAIGLSLYTRLLAQAIEELKFGKVQEPIRDILIDLPLEAYIPKDFLPEEERLVLYQKLAGTVKLDELNALKEKMIASRTKEEQRTFPTEILNLFEVLEVRILAQGTDISHIDTSLVTDDFGHKKRRIIMKFLFPLKPEQLARLLQHNSHWQFNDDSLKIDLKQLGDNWLEELKKSIRYFINTKEDKKEKASSS